MFAGVAIGILGTRLSGLADRLADLTRMGEALMGGVFLGASTSLSGITASAVAAADGYPQLSLANAIGGIAAQMLMLVAADFAYPRVNLEHAAASVESMMQGALQITMLGLLLLAFIGPDLHLFGIHYMTPILPLAYALGITVISRGLETPMWRPRMTRETRTDQPDEHPGNGQSLVRIWSEFILIALGIMVTGWVLTISAERIAAETVLSESLVGGLFVAVTTSLAELVTSIAAVRRGALTLAVSGILGGNAFDALFAAIADVFYREGSIYHAASVREMGLLTITIIMSGLLLFGLLRREKRGLGKIGFEGIGIIVVYAMGVLMLALYNG
ncbi:MAG: sodium:calcium antiporter [Chitinivibrionales bacterium]|nr:sodium:calcium antiporter [Chitinivibrionales bacterium]MBD3356792.1 sodium:calcium antiporter [Chitinivibrionales bacterium]